MWNAMQQYQVPTLGGPNRPRDIGVLAMEAYFPRTYVSQAQLGKDLSATTKIFVNK